MKKLPVIFRISRDKLREVTAVFPTLPFDRRGSQFTVYAHIGQHGGASIEWFHSARHRSAKPEEYADLLRELRGIYGVALFEGDEVYELVPVMRNHSSYRRAFREETRRLQKLGA